MNNDGLLGYNFRALTGNRRVVDGRVCHLSDESLNLLRHNFKGSTKPVLEYRHHLSDSVIFMLSNGRRFATTESSLGFVPTKTEVGDRIAILIGCSVPVIIQEFITTGGESHWILKGECYIEGLIDGEFVNNAEDRGLHPQAITLL